MKTKALFSRRIGRRVVAFIVVSSTRSMAKIRRCCSGGQLGEYLVRVRGRSRQLGKRGWWQRGAERGWRKGEGCRLRAGG